VLLTIVPVLAVLPIGTTLAQTPATVGTGTPESCTTTALHEAFATGDDITFDCRDDPHEMTMNATDDVTGTMVVEGDHLITLHAGPNHRHFTVIDTGTLTLQDLTLSSGIATWGGVVRNQGGTLHVIGSMLSGNTASEGGAIYISANSTTTIFDSTFNLNHA